MVRLLLLVMLRCARLLLRVLIAVLVLILLGRICL